MDSLYQLSACEVVAGLQSGEFTVEDTLDSLEKRIARVNPEINAMVTLCFDRARHHAGRIKNSAEKSPGFLYGLPVAIKDLTCVKGVRTTFGSRVYENHVPEYSDQLVRKIESEGGVIYAKTNTPEFGTGGITFNDVIGITRSPHGTSCSSGGSSGGAAASLASGCSWLSHGSDMAGSLRTPASFCGVTSLRPSPGRIRSDSDFLPFDVLSAEGPMARGIEDLALFADAMMSNGNKISRRATQQPERPGRVAISRDLGITTVSDETGTIFENFVDNLIHSGWDIVEDQPDLSGVHETFDTLRANNYAISMEQTLLQNPGVMKPEVVWNIESGLALTAGQIRQALRNQGQIVNEAARFIRDVDLLICPATSVVSVPAELRYPGSDGDVPVEEYYRWLAVAYAITMTALPVITMPCGYNSNAMPVGIQLIGKPWGEENLFKHARHLELELNWSSLPMDPVNKDRSFQSIHS